VRHLKILATALLLAAVPAAASAQKGELAAAKAAASTRAAAKTVRVPGIERPLRVCAGGDVTLGTNLDTTWVHTARARAGRRVAAFPDPDSLLSPLKPLFADADVVLLNVEGAIGTGPAPRKCGPSSTACFAFRQPIAAAAALRRVNEAVPVVGNVANNHAGDAGPAGFRQTQRHLREAGVHVTGADTLATEVVTADGDTVAFLGFSQWTGPDPRNLAAVRRHVARAAERYRRVVVTMHMGAEGVRAQRTPDADERFYGNRGNSVAFARVATEAGADLVVGHGPHVMRAVQRRGDAVIFYSLGNLMTYGPFSMAEPLNRGAVACATLDADGVVREASLIPTRQRPPGLVSRDDSGKAVALADSLGRLDFPRSYVPVGGDGVLALSPDGEGPRVLGKPVLAGEAAAPAPRRRRR
jgi:hypothetical protein